MTINGISSVMLALSVLYPSLFLLAGLALSAPSATNTTSTNSEINALLAFKSSIRKDPTGALANWTMENNSDYCITWKGVVCDEIGQVTGIDLGDIMLNGTISPMIGDLIHLTFLNLSGNKYWGRWRPAEYQPVQYLSPIPTGLDTLWGQIPSELMRCKNLSIIDLSFNSLDGRILPELFTLPQLEFLRLSFNRFTGPLPEIPENGCQSLMHLRITNTSVSETIPSTLSRCRNLMSLTLNFNHLTGSIPSSLTQLQQLQVLALENNTLTGQIPSKIGLLKNLVQLTLYENHLEGHIPPSIGMLSQLLLLDLSDNRLTGSIPPSLGNCSLLAGLSLYANRLTGPIPPSLGMLSQLTSLQLQDNSLSGSIPPSLGNCSSLVELWLGRFNTGYNRLTGNIPEEFGNLTSLVVLSLQYNSQLTGQIPGSLSKCLNLQALLLGGCGFTGIAPEIWTMKSLSTLLLFQNNLSGTLPLEVGNCTSLSSLDLSSNRLTGSIPPTLIMLKGLTTLSLHTNMFTGIIPSLSECQNLETLRLGQNQFKGTLQFDFTKWSTLKYFSVTDNNLIGQIPPSFASTNSSLIIVDFSQNNFIGEFPAQVDSTHLSDLRVLLFSQNQLEGAIPSWFGNLKSLQVLDLSSNKLTGFIPQNFGNLDGYKVHGNVNASSVGAAFTLNETLNLAIKGQSIRLEYTYILLTTTYMDLSSNALEGGISSGITDLVGLKYLILSNNKLEGVIGNDFQNLEDLETLDLSQNNLTGPVPLLLPSYVSTFNVSLNNLSGAIPTGGQFDTFNASSYLPGNPGLCGEIIHRPCVDPKVESYDSSSSTKHEILDYMSAPAFGIGILSGYFTVVVTVLAWAQARVFVFGAAEKLEAAPMVQSRYGLFRNHL